MSYSSRSKGRAPEEYPRWFTATARNPALATSFITGSQESANCGKPCSRFRTFHERLEPQSICLNEMPSTHARHRSRIAAAEQTLTPTGNDTNCSKAVPFTGFTVDSFDTGSLLIATGCGSLFAGHEPRKPSKRHRISAGQKGLRQSIHNCFPFNDATSARGWFARYTFWNRH